MLTPTEVMSTTSAQRISPHNDDQRCGIRTRNRHSSNATRTPPHTATAETKHNLDTDQLAAGIALRLAHRPALVLSEHTNTDELALFPGSELTRWSTAPGAPEWAQLIGANLTAWWAWQRRRGAVARTRMHDVATLGAALGEPFAEFATQNVHVLRDARTRRDPNGREMLVSKHIDCHAVMGWLHDTVYAA